MRAEPRIAVALHDVEPATHARCAEIRAWLAGRGVDRLTLLVIPAPRLHPFHVRHPEMAAWLRALAAGGDEVAQHGLRHRQTRRPWAGRQALARLQGGGSAEFPGLGAAETRRAVETGRRVLRLAGVEPAGFVAPAYAYTPALRHALSDSFAWWADIARVHRGGARLGAGARLVGPAPPLPGRPRRRRPPAARFAPALCLGSSSPLRRTLSPVVVRALGRLGGTVIRLDVHPADFAHAGHVAALEAVLERAAGRRAVTYGELVAR